MNQSTDARARIDGAIFDLDGVLVDTEHLWEESWSRYSARHGYRWTVADTATVQGMSALEWAQYIADRIGAHDRASEANTACVDYMLDAVGRGEGQLLGGARALVTALAERCPIALASSAPRRLIEAVLAHHGLAGCFTATVSSEEVPRGKPSPDVYAEAARRIDVKPGRGVAFEDSSNGIRAAAAADLLVVALPNRKYPPKPDALRLATFVASDHDEALRYVLSLLLPGGSE